MMTIDGMAERGMRSWLIVHLFPKRNHGSMLPAQAGGSIVRIASLETGFYRIELPVALSDSTHGTITHFELITVRLRDSDGAEGVGYTYTVGAGGAAVHALIDQGLRPVLLGAEAEQIEALWQKMWWHLHFGGRGGSVSLAVSACDIALWDLKARRFNTPLWRLLGGFNPAVPCYAGGIDLDFPLDALLRQTDDNLAKGFRAIKMKVGRPRLSEDVQRVQAMRAHLGDDFPLMVDANMRWSVDQSIRAARAFQPSNLIWLEEPTIPDDVAGHARIVREGGLPIATGENLHTLHEFKQMIEAGGVTFPEPDVTNCGGVTIFMKVAHLAEAYNLPLTSHGVHDLTVHLLAAAPNRSYLEVHGFGLDRYIAEPLTLHDGNAIAPERPGHGVAFDWAALEKLHG
jgi:L-alanine-DL-glutamate epimerase-like enolase superfamily enzyme